MTAKKKHLIELMIEAGVKWPEGAEYAAQDKVDKRVHFYKNGKPERWNGDGQWLADSRSHMSRNGIFLHEICCNWHQTIVTREQYENALADEQSSKEEDSLPHDEDGNIEYPVKKTIEQLAADYHAKAEEAQRLQSAANDALKVADNALIALELAGEAIGLVISIDTSK